MRTALALLAAVLISACAAPQRRGVTVPAPPGVEPPASSALPEVGPEWRGADVDAGRPVRLPDGRAALVLVRMTGDRREVALALAPRRAGRAAVVPLATVDLAGSRREILTSLGTLALDGEPLLRVDLRVFERVPPRYFAVKIFVVSAGDPPRPLLERLIESGNDVRDRRARVSTRDLDGDGRSELIFEERESGEAGSRRVVYRRRPGAGFVTTDRSLFAE